jgi:uncharacterized protein (TIGR02265 family)
VSTEATTDGSVFEALFVRLLQPQGTFKDDLRAAGYDPDHLEMRYPNAVLLATLDVAARHVYPELSREAAHRKLGRRFTDRYFTTLLGRITRTLVLSLGVDRFVMQLPKFVRLSATGVSITVQKLGPGDFKLVYTCESQSPDFIAGSLEGGVDNLSTFNLHAQVVRRQPAEFELRVTKA